MFRMTVALSDTYGMLITSITLPDSDYGGVLQAAGGATGAGVLIPRPGLLGVGRGRGRGAGVRTFVPGAVGKP